MSVQDAFYRSVHDYPGGCESLAPRMGMSPAVLRNKANPHSTTNIPSLRDADAVMAITGDYSVLHELAANHGHVCIKVDADAPAGDLAVLELVTRVWAANGDVGHCVDEALADGRVDRRELERVRGAIYRTQQAMHSMLARLEDMAEPPAAERRAAQCA